MNQKTFSLVVGVIFLLIALGHLVRLVFGVEWRVADRSVPHWISWVALVVMGFLAYQGFRLSRKD